MSIKKKITVNNCFHVEIESAVSASSGDNNFREVTPVLTAVTEIYEKRVEATHADAIKARSGFAAGAASDDEDDADTTLDPENAGRRRNARKKTGQESYIEKNPNSLNMKKNDQLLGLEFDPIFNAMTVGESGSTPLAAALLSQIRLHPGAILAMDSNDHFGDFEAAQNKQGDSTNENLEAGTVRLDNDAQEATAEGESNQENNANTDNNGEEAEGAEANADAQEEGDQGENAEHARTEDEEGEHENEEASNKTVAEQTTTTTQSTTGKACDENEDLFRPQRFSDLAYCLPKSLDEFSLESLCQTYAGFQFSGWKSDQQAYVYPQTSMVPALDPPKPNLIALLGNNTHANACNNDQDDDNEDRFQSEYDQDSFSFPSSPSKAASSTPVDPTSLQFEIPGTDPSEDASPPAPEFHAPSPQHFDNDDFDYIGDDGDADNGELLGEVDYNDTIKQFNMLAANPTLPVIPTINLEERGNKWAGPAFWRYFPPGPQSSKKRREMDSGQGDDNDNEREGATAAKTKTRARRAEPFRIDFSQPVDLSSFVRSGNINLSKANLDKANPTDNLLPPDQRYGMRDLLSFFVRSEWQELSFIEAGAGEEKEVGYHYPTAEEDVGPPDYFDHGDYDDDEGGPDMGMGGMSMVMGMGAGNGANGASSTGGYFGIGSMSASHQQHQQQQSDTYNMLAPRRLGLTALQSTLNVKNLKSAISSELEVRLPANTQKRGKNRAVDDDDETTAEPTKFQGILSSIPDRVDNPEQLSQVSVPFCFICLLHLANEKGLELSQDHDSLSEQLASLSVARPVF